MVKSSSPPPVSPSVSPPSVSPPSPSTKRYNPYVASPNVSTLSNWVSPVPPTGISSGPNANGTKSNAPTNPIDVNKGKS